MTRVIPLQRPPLRTTVRFWLKPHLHDFVRSISGGDIIDVHTSNVIGAMAMSVLTPKSSDAHRHRPGVDFKQGRKPLHASISLRTGERHGFVVSHCALFEFLVEHLFYTQMLVYVDACMEAGASQNGAIRKFLDRHKVDLANLDESSVKRTIIRRRERLNVARAA